MKYMEESLQLYNDGLSCSQALLVAFTQEHGLERELAMRMTRAFMGGMALGLICGVVTTSFMILSINLGPVGPDEREKRFLSFDVCREFARRFEAQHGTLSCKDLLGVDLSTDEGMAFVQRTQHCRKACPAFIQSSVTILEELLADENYFMLS